MVTAERRIHTLWRDLLSTHWGARHSTVIKTASQEPACPVGLEAGHSLCDLAKVLNFSELEFPYL